ncbi:MAG: hypothetical protein ACI9S8_002424 [Chlamydiales bacterium]|jgi:hypothetical protein
MNEQLKLRSSINNQLLTSLLIKANLIALPGIILIIAAGIWLPPTQLSSWGWALVLLGFAFVALGMIPYKRLFKLQMQPHEIIVNEDSLHFAAKGKSSFTIPLEAIKKIEYLAKGKVYGIRVFLRENIKKKVCVHDTELHIEAFQEDSKTRFDCDLFLPYFHENSFKKLQSIFCSHPELE